MKPQLYILWKRSQHFVGHHHPVIFISVVAILLGAAIFILSQILAVNLIDTSEGTPTIGKFDQKTIDKINDLHMSGSKNDTPLVFPSPRPNPFVE